MRCSLIHTPLVRPYVIGAFAATLLGLALLTALPNNLLALSLHTSIQGKGDMSSDSAIYDTYSVPTQYSSLDDAVHAVHGAVSASSTTTASPKPGGDFGPTNVQTSCSASCNESISLPFLSPGYRIQVTMHYSGAKPTALQGSNASVNASVNLGSGALVANYSQDALGHGADLPSVFTVSLNSDAGGIAFSYTILASAQSTTPDQGHSGYFTSASFSGTLGRGTIQILDPSGNSVDYSLDNSTGSIKALTYPAGAAFSSFAVTNAASDSNHTTMQLLDGNAGSSPTQVNASFVAPPSSSPLTSAVKVASDALELTGTAGRLAVVQMSYNPSVVASQNLAETSLRLVWQVPLANQFVNAIFGNSGPAASQFVARPYNPATDLQLGKHGLDTTNHTAWAVVDHNSEFVVAVPQPYLLVRSITHPAAQTIHLNCFGQADAPNQIETSTDLVTWTTLATVTADSSGAFQYDDTSVTGGKKFYRVSLPAGQLARQS